MSKVNHSICSLVHCSIKATNSQRSFSSRLDDRIEKLKPSRLSVNVDLSKVASYLYYITDSSFSYPFKLKYVVCYAMFTW